MSHELNTTAGPLYRRQPGDVERDYVPTYHPCYRPDSEPVTAIVRGAPAAIATTIQAPLHRSTPRKGAPTFVFMRTPNPKQARSIERRAYALMQKEPREWSSLELSKRMRDERASITSKLSYLVATKKVEKRRDPSSPRQVLYRLAGVKIEGEGK